MRAVRGMLTTSLTSHVLLGSDRVVQDGPEPGEHYLQMQTWASPSGNEETDIIELGHVVSQGLRLDGEHSIDDNHCVCHPSRREGDQC